MLVDTHSHLDDARFADDRPAVLDRAAAVGVRTILTIGIDRRTSQAAVELATRFPDQLRAVVGIQPNHVHEAEAHDLEVIQQLAREPGVVALGETGLDRYWDQAPFPMQEEYFRWHLHTARECQLPVVIHCREAEADVVRLLRDDAARHGATRGVMHSFSGDEATARACLELGLYISFAGMLTYKSAGTLREVARVIPAERLLVETDSPYLAPVPHRGKRNEPAFVAHTARFLAELRGEPWEELAAQTTANAHRLFDLGPIIQT